MISYDYYKLSLPLRVCNTTTEMIEFSLASKRQYTIKRQTIRSVAKHEKIVFYFIKAAT